MNVSLELNRICRDNPNIHRLFGGPLDGEVRDMTMHVGRAKARFTFQTHLPSPDGWGGGWGGVQQVEYVPRETTFGDQTFTIWVWSELP